MKNETKKLCLWASKLYESQKMSADSIYDLLVNTNSRIKEVAQARQLVGYVLYNNTNMILQQVAEEMGLTNHSTIVHWMDVVQVQLRNNKRMQFKYQFLLDIFNGVEREFIRTTFKGKSKYHLSNADIDFIKSNLDKNKNICYYADTLNKTRTCIKKYLKKIAQ